ncbi:bifunctional acetate--CoA ligase family protein/GNAT family N-acetyltransferase [Stakelama marina]|uniref:Bifunctional acetate--CoA ligase family protein/GNAT family N-acetyltransferase n=1 Tax=Stakelama marina TaxID=2826939 RepID=A0A8T4I9K1_9SPHN|nr:bifunctional acetate--CoA ligase family protein/GNAT family N-acetyltransferase [Stakelama marina]MBR0551307.1 bifunctional acetate--CoA ligase family protein/GNAT family N-acetyltransferase [Stakelama marina]
MTTRNLDTLLHPRSVAVIGASHRDGSVGQRLMANLGDFAGTVYAVNPRASDADGPCWVRSVAELPETPDLAVVAAPADQVADVISELGEKGVRMAVVISAGLHDPERRQAVLDAAGRHCLRLIGPNSLGILLPQADLNASFAQVTAPRGRLALLSQSGALVTAMLDWARDRRLGFSSVISMGDMIDVDFGDMIDLLANDPGTDAILLYVESITDPAKFMSAARAASRIKPVVALKAGRSAAASRAAVSHTGRLAGAYDVHLAAFERAGIVAVDTLDGLLDAAQILSTPRRTAGRRIAVITNGGGPGILAADAITQRGGELARLGPSTIEALDGVLPAGWSGGNPIDVVGDAHADRFAAALDVVGRDEDVDAILVLHSPTAVATGTEIARAVADCVGDTSRFPGHVPVVGCWLGDSNCDEVRPILSEAKLPLFGSIAHAAQAFVHLWQAEAARSALMQAPAHARAAESDRARAMAVIRAARHDGRTILSAAEAKSLLAGYGVPVLPAQFARTPEAVAAACEQLDPPFVVKVVSPQVTHKSDIGGVALDLPNAEAAVEAAHAMRGRISHEEPHIHLDGFEVETMVERPHGHELLIGVADDPTFGPVMTVGAGGTAVELIGDRALGLPPLDDRLARAMIAKTRIARLMAGYRDVPAANIDAVSDALNAVSALVVDLPDIVELDINPLLADESGVIALDARVRISPEPAQSRLAIRPVPIQWAADLTTRSGELLHVRPVVPTDEDVLSEFFRHVTPEDLRFRFLSAVREVGHERIAAMTQIDYRRTMTFLAFAGDSPVAVAMLAADPDHLRAELAITVREGWKRKGVSWTLMEHVLRYAEADGIRIVESLESTDNVAALKLEREMGFTTTPVPGSPGEMIVRKQIAPVA